MAPPSLFTLHNRKKRLTFYLHYGKLHKPNMLAFSCAIPSGAASRIAYGSRSARGDGAHQKCSVPEGTGLFLCCLTGTQRLCTVGDENSTSGRSASRPVLTVLRTVKKCAGPGGVQMEEWGAVRHPLRGPPKTALHSMRGCFLLLHPGTLRLFRARVPLWPDWWERGQCRAFSLCCLTEVPKNRKTDRKAIHPESLAGKQEPLSLLLPGGRGSHGGNVRCGGKNRSPCWSPAGR